MKANKDKNQQNQQELIFRLSVIEQQANQLQQQIQAVEQGIVELSSLNLGLEELKGSKGARKSEISGSTKYKAAHTRRTEEDFVGKEIKAPIGRGIFVDAKVLSEDLIVDVGGKNFVKKSIDETKSMIDEQVGKLQEIKSELKDNLEKLGEEMNRIISGAQESKDCSCEHNHECECEEDCDCEED